MFWFVVFLFILGGSFYCYSRLKTLEKEIRTEQAAEKSGRDSGHQDAPVKEVPDKVEKGILKTDPDNKQEQQVTLETRLLDLVRRNPGTRQADLYNEFAEIEKRQLQQLLKQMSDAGQLKREKQGSSYLLFPV